MDARDFIVRRERLQEHRLIDRKRQPLAAGAVELQVERFGLTSNNITYGVLGESFSYFRFFPVDEPGWGRIPAWGFGIVTRSASPGVAIGERFYGYYPMSSHLVVEPGRTGDAGFVDDAPHRRHFGGVYNQYLRTSRDSSYAADTEAHQVVLRPVFATAFFLVDFLVESGFFGAERVLISSASSKLGYATAFVLRSQESKRRRLIALTSARNADFVSRLGLYEDVVPYEAVRSLGRDELTVYVDLAGNADVRSAVHDHLGAELRHSSVIGATHWSALGETDDLPGPKPETFFAPAWIKRRAAEWGAAEVQRRLGEAWRGFVREARDASRGWITIIEGTGGDAVARAYDALVSGEARPEHGYVLSLSEREESPWKT